MNITFIIPSMTKGGAERVIANLSNYLTKNGNEVNIITILNTDISYNLDSKIKSINIDKKYTPISEIENNYKGMKKILHYCRKIIKQVKRNLTLKKIVYKLNTDIYISFLPEACFSILKCRKIIKVPIIVSVRNDPKIEYNNLYNKLQMMTLYKKADGFVFQTEEAKNYFSKKIKEKSIIIPNPINENFIIDKFIYNKTKKIVSVGRLVEQKNHFLLIDSFYKIYDKYKDYKLYIYGEGYLKNDLNNYIKKLGLEKNVILKGNVNKIKEEIEDASLFVLSSNYEGMPNALMEAMCLGIPVISTDCPCGGPKFLITNNKNGKLVKINDKNDLSIAMDQILSNKEFSIELGKNAQKIVEELSPKIINQKWYNYIKKIEEKGRNK